MGSQQNSRCGVEERKTTKHISGGWGWFGFLEVFREVG